MSEKPTPQPGDVIEVRDSERGWVARIFVTMGSTVDVLCFAQPADDNCDTLANHHTRGIFLRWGEWRIATPTSVESAADAPEIKRIGIKPGGWVDCPICGGKDMQRTLTVECESPLIHCVNHACLSNGGENMSALYDSGHIAELRAGLEAQVEDLENWRELAFVAHPNIDLDIDRVREEAETDDVK